MDTLYKMSTEITSGVVTFTPVSNVLKPIEIQNMVFEDGIYKSVPGWEKSAVSLQFKTSITYGSKVRVSFKRSVTYSNQGNWKWFRVWKDQPGNSLNWYVGQPYVGWIMTYSEPLPVNSNTRTSLDLYLFSTFAWREEVYEWKVPSSCGAKDGKLKITIDGIVVLNKINWQTDDKDHPGVPNYICVQDDPSNFEASGGVLYRDVVVEVL